MEDEGVPGTGHSALGSTIHFGETISAPLILDFFFRDPTLRPEAVEVVIVG